MTIALVVVLGWLAVFGIMAFRGALFPALIDIGHFFRSIAPSHSSGIERPSRQRIAWLEHDLGMHDPERYGLDPGCAHCSLRSGFPANALTLSAAMYEMTHPASRPLILPSGAVYTPSGDRPPVERPYMPNRTSQ